MGDIDRKFLGVSSKRSGRQDQPLKIENKQEDPEDLVDFNH